MRSLNGLTYEDPDLQIAIQRHKGIRLLVPFMEIFDFEYRRIEDLRRRDDPFINEPENVEGYTLLRSSAKLFREKSTAVMVSCYAPYNDQEVFENNLSDIYRTIINEVIRRSGPPKTEGSLVGGSLFEYESKAIVLKKIKSDIVLIVKPDILIGMLPYVNHLETLLKTIAFIHTYYKQEKCEFFRSVNFLRDLAEVGGFMRSGTEPNSFDDAACVIMSPQLYSHLTAEEFESPDFKKKINRAFALFADHEKSLADLSDVFILEHLEVFWQIEKLTRN